MRRRPHSRRAAVSDEELSKRNVVLRQQARVPAISRRKLLKTEPLPALNRDVVLADHKTLLQGAQTLEKLRHASNLSQDAARLKVELQALIKAHSEKVVRDDCVTAVREAQELDGHLQSLFTEELFRHDTAKVVTQSDAHNSKAVEANANSFVDNIATIVKTVADVRTKFEELQASLANCDRILELACPGELRDTTICGVIAASERSLEQYRWRCSHWLSKALTTCVETMCIYFDLIAFDKLAALCLAVEDFNNYVRKPINGLSVNNVSIIEVMARRQATASANKIAVLLRGEAKKAASARKRQLQPKRQSDETTPTSDYFTGSEQEQVAPNSVVRGVDLSSLLAVVSGCNQRVLMKLIFASQRQRAATTDHRPSGRPTWARVDEAAAREHQQQYRRCDAMYWREFWTVFAARVEHELLNVQEQDSQPLTLCDKEIGSAVVDAVERALADSGDGEILSEEAVEALSGLRDNLKYALVMRDWSRETALIVAEMDTFTLSRSMRGGERNRTRIGRAFSSVIESLVGVAACSTTMTSTARVVERDKRVTEALQLTLNCLHNWLRTKVSHVMRGPLAGDTMHAALVLLLCDLEAALVALAGHNTQRQKEITMACDDDQEVASLSSHERTLRALRDKLLASVTSRLGERARALFEQHMPVKAYLRHAVTVDDRWLVQVAAQVSDQPLESLLVVQPSRASLAFKAALLDAVCAALIDVIVEQEIKFARIGGVRFGQHVRLLDEWADEQFGAQIAQRCVQMRRLRSFADGLQVTRRPLTNNRIAPSSGEPIVTSSGFRNGGLNARAHRVNFLCAYCPSLAVWW